MRGLCSLSLLVSGLVVGACGGASGDDVTGDDVPPGVVDVRVPIPAADPNIVDIITPEVQIEAGAEKMYCYYTSNALGELAIHNLDVLQGQYGHHMVLVTTTEPMPDGTLEDCSDVADMAKFRAFIIPVGEPPAGYAVDVPAGHQYVLQFHYVNAGDAPILVRDVARLQKIPVESVTTWLASLATADLRLTIPPGGGNQTFDCTVPEDVDLLLLGGHMHENGTKITIDIGATTDSLENMYLVDPWKPVYRDSPPVSLFFQTPYHLAAGTVVRTHCEFTNAGTTPLEFPAEMCTAFGYIGGTKTPFNCVIGTN